MAPAASDAGEIAKEEVDAVFAAALAAAPPLREVPPPPSFIRQTDETKEEEVKEEIGVNVVNVPPPPNATMGNNTIQREQHEQRAISTFIVKADDDEKIITQTEKEEEKLALTAREAFLATFANYDKKKTLGLRNGDEKGDEERGKMATVVVGSYKIEKSTAESDSIAIAVRIDRPVEVYRHGNVGERM